MAADRQLAVQLACANALAESATLQQALPRVLEAVCTGQGFAWGVAWMKERASPAAAMEFVAEWPESSVHDERKFTETCARGVHRFPVRDGEELVGVIELCNPQLGRPDDGLRALMTSIGAQLARFVQHVEGRARLYDAEKRARSAAEAEARRQAFLALAGALLTSSIDYESTLELLPRLAASTLADWCLLDVAERDGRAVRVAVAHANPADADHELARAVRTPPSDVAPAGGDLAVQPLLLAQASDAALAVALHDEHEALLLRSVGTHSLMRVPLAARGRTFGVLTLLRTRTPGSFEPSDLGLAEELALTAAVAIDKAALQRETEEALRVRDKFLSIVSHDLTSPLHVIQLNVKLCADVLAMLPPAGAGSPANELAGGIERIGRAAGRINALVHELYEVAHGPARDPIVLHRAPIDLVALVRHVVDEYQQEWRDRGLELRSSTPTLVGLFDQHRIERVVANLVSNAVKYSRPGGHVRVDVSCEWQGTQDATTRWAVIEVADEGIGIPQAFLPQLFVEGRRAANALADAHIGGRGMGLASAHQIVARHGGTITVASCEGQGSTFTVRLPLDGPSR